MFSLCLPCVGFLHSHPPTVSPDKTLNQNPINLINYIIIIIIIIVLAAMVFKVLKEQEDYHCNRISHYYFGLHLLTIFIID